MSPPNPTSGEIRPILFLIVDCLRADRAFAQAKLEPEGFLGRLVRSGFSFRNAVTVTPTTTPAVATMLTGCYPFEHGVRGLAGFTRPETLPTIASVLREAGYRTEADVAGPLFPELRLFDEFDRYRLAPHKQETIHGERGELVGARARELAAGEQPSFSVVHIWDLHEPRQVPDGFRGRSLSRSIYDRALAALDARLTEIFPPELTADSVVMLIGDHGENLRFEPRGKPGKAFASLLWWRGSRWAAQPLVRRVIRRGAHSSSKRLLRLAPRALITHGHHLFEPLLRVPYIAAGPGIPHGGSDALVAHTDLAPTFAELAGTWFQGGSDARPLSFTDGGDDTRRVILETAWVTSLPGVRQIGVRTSRWKYMELADGGAPALFDLAADERERRNVIAGYPKVAEELREDLRAALSGERLGGRMSDESAEIVEKRLVDLGYFN